MPDFTSQLNLVESSPIWLSSGFLLRFWFPTAIKGVLFSHFDYRGLVGQTGLAIAADPYEPLLVPAVGAMGASASCV